MSISRVAFTTKTGTLAVIGLTSTILGWLTVFDVEQSISGGGLLPIPLLIVLPMVLVIFFLPNWILLVSVIPLLIMISYIFSIPPLISIGDASIHIYDLVIPVVMLKALSFSAVHRQRIEIYSSIAIFIIVLLLATMLAYYRFGLPIFKSEMIPLLRLITQVSTFFLFVHSVRTFRQLELSYKFVGFFGYAAAASLFIDMALFPFGMRLGEVSAGQSVVRFFGPLGDPVGFLLPFFIYKEFMASKMLRAGFFGTALLATGVRGALISFVIGFIVLLLYMKKERFQDYNYWPALAAFVGIIVLAFYFDLGGMATRSQNVGMEDETFGQRLLIISHATRVFLDNILVGVGFTGFRFAVQNYSGPTSLVATTANQYLQVATDAGLLGLAAFLWMVINFLQTLNAAQSCASDGLRDFLVSGYAWLLGLLIGNQSASWLLPGSMISYLLWMILGIASVTRGMRSQGTEIRIKQAR